jgi:plasmid stabilization system protein ParE
MPRIRWSEKATLDRIRFYQFLAPKSSEAALRAQDVIRRGIKILATHSEAGRPIDDLPLEFRELVIDFGHGGYVVRYRFDAECVVILSIRHGREDGY